MAARAMGNWLVGRLSALLIVIVWSVSANAHPSLMLTGGLTSQPYGHLELCKRLPAECSVRSEEQAPLVLTEKLKARLEAVTAWVNSAVMPESDIDVYGIDEYWTYPEKRGDCEDYVLLKRRILMDEGVSASHLLITVLKKPDGEGHAVLTVRTDTGDLILDNLNDALNPWDETGYIYLKRQATYDSGRWVTVREGHSELVGSVQ